MATENLAPSVASTLQQYFPSIASSSSAASSDSITLSKTIYPTTSYANADKSQVDEWLQKSSNIDSAEQLNSLNTHLSSRTTILGSKPSIADVILYSKLAPVVKKWTPEERTGEHGHHHIVRYVDFIQRSPIIGLSVSEDKIVDIDPDKVLFVPKPIDPKEEKERKKKEKAAAAGGAAGTEGKPLVVGQGKPAGEKTKKEKVKDALSHAKESVKGAVGAGEGKKEKKEKAPKPQKAPAKETPLSPALIDLRVGHILKAIAHPNADSLYVSTIAVGDAPGTDNTSEYEGQVVRTVCSGLNGLIPLEEMQNRKIVAVCNLKPVTMRGIKSSAMVLAASPRLNEGEVDNHAGPVELVSPPEDSKAGDRILFDGWEGEPEGVLNPKKKVWEMCQVGFTTTDDLGVAFELSKVEQLQGEAGAGKPALGELRVKGGEKCTVKSLKGATVR